MRNQHQHTLNLRVGETVEVKSPDEILSTLDSRGTLDALPFMPEMLRHCGKRFRVYKRADKTCQYILSEYSTRRMYRTVHLEGLHCDGAEHGGCEASCLLFWKESWLRRMDGKSTTNLPSGGSQVVPEWGNVPSEKGTCSLETLLESTRAPNGNDSLNTIRYSCQATEILKATREMKWWDVRQYYRDIRSGNVCIRHFLKWTPVAMFNALHLRIRGWRRYPFIDHRLVQRSYTPKATLDLQPGEYVQIKSLEEILKTLNVRMRNRGLLFAKELVPYCGKTAKVLKKVNKIINEGNGEMIFFNNDCVILEGVICTGFISDKRLFCPRSMYPFWREIWLKRIEPII